MTIEMANRLCGYRKAHRLSQEDLAERIGVSRQAVSKWERAEASPDTDNLILLARLYGVTLDDLLYTDCAPEPQLESDPEPASVSASESVPESASAPELTVTEASAAPQVVGTIDAEAAEDALRQRIRAAYAIPIPVVCLIAYLIFGFGGICGGWAYGWLVFLAIPLYYTLISAVEIRNPTHFAFPVLVLWVYLWLGFRFGLWHTMWILFLTVAIYYPVCEALQSRS